METPGIAPVPADQRHGQPSDLFWVWFATAVSVLGVSLGIMLVGVYALPVWQAVIVSVLGITLAYGLAGGIAVGGARTGMPSLVLSRHAFGRPGAVPPAVVVSLARLTAQVVMLTSASAALLDLVDLVGGGSGSDADATDTPLLAWGALLLLGAVVALVAARGYGTVVAVAKWASAVLVLFTALLIIMLSDKLAFSAVSGPAAPIGTAVACVFLVAAMTGLGWVDTAADTARFQPSDRRTGSVVLPVVLGAGLPTLALILIGGWFAAADDGSSRTVAGLTQGLPTWATALFLVTVVVGSVTALVVSSYSAGLTLLATGLPLRRSHGSVVTVAVSVLVAGYVSVVSTDTTLTLQMVATVLTVLVASWAGVLVMELVLRASRPVVTVVFEGVKDPWAESPVARPRYSALVAWLVGVVVGWLFSAPFDAEWTWLVGPFAESWFALSGLNWTLAIVAAAGAYAALDRPTPEVTAPARTDDAATATQPDPGAETGRDLNGGR